MVQGRANLVGPGNIDERKRVGGGLDAADIHFLKLLNVSEDAIQLGTELLDFFSGQGKPRQVRHVVGS